jgi:hypothetical protein
MPMINPCIEPGCSTLCMGLFCIEHDARPQADFPRGRPWPPVARAPQATVVSVPAFEDAPAPALVSVRPAA